MEVNIQLLRDNQNYIPILAESLYHEFARQNETLDFFTQILINGCRDNDLPMFLIATDMQNKILLGTVAIWRCDLMTRQDLFPWLSLLFVKKEYRGHHIGKALQEAAIKQARKQNFTNIYLYTDLCGYYEKTNWHKIGIGIECDGTEKQLFMQKL